MYNPNDQYGLTYDNPFETSSMLPRFNSEADSQSDVSSISGFGSLETNYVDDNILKPPPEKQGNLDSPLQNPKPNALAKDFDDDLFSRVTEQLPNDDEFERPNENPSITPKPKKKKLKNKNVEFIIEDDDKEEAIILPKPRGRPPGSKNKKKDTSKVFIQDNEEE
jgi:hypothetical protein